MCSSDLGVFYCNNWPPQPVLVEVDNEEHPVTKNLPASFVAPASEWYQWTPSPRQNKDVEVLLSLSPKNYPLGIKDVVNFGDFPHCMVQQELQNDLPEYGTW